MQDNKKAGELALERLNHDPETTDVVEMQREMMKEYCDNVMKAASEGLKVYKGPFYVVVITKRERIMHNVLRSYYFHRETCPTPDYDQAVFKFDRNIEKVEEMWVIPDKDTCDDFYTYPLEVHPEERQLLSYVLDYYSGTLLNKAKMLNGEEKNDIPIILSLHNTQEELLCQKNSLIQL